MLYWYLKISYEKKTGEMMLYAPMVFLRGEVLGIMCCKNTPKDIFGNSRQYSILCGPHKASILFYISRVIEAKGDRSGAIALERLISNYNAGDRDKCRLLDDTLRMYDGYYDTLPVEYKQDFINNGPTRAIHDRLAALITAKLNQDREFCVSHEQRSLEGVVENMSLRLAVNSNMLCEIGCILHNCVASYADLAAKGIAAIFYALVDGKISACIELMPSANGFSIHQALGKYNQRLSSEEQRLILRWVRANDISIECSHLDEAVRAEVKENVKAPVWKLVTKEIVTK